MLNKDSLQTKYNINDILPHVENRQGVEEFVSNLEKDDTENMHGYTKWISGIGAYIAVINFLGFFAISKIIDLNSPIQVLIWGLIFMVLGIFIYRYNVGEYKNIRQNFSIQLSFSLVGIGKIFVVWGIASFFENEWAITAGLFLVTIVTYPIYKSSIDRFFSSFLTILSVIINILFLSNLKEFKEPLIDILFLVLLAVGGFLFLSHKIKQKYIPLAYACIFSAGIIVALFMSANEFGLFSKGTEISDTVISIFLGIALIILIAWIIGSFDKIFRSEPLIIAVAAIILMTMFSASGILFAILLLILGYATHDKIITVTGILSTPIFISFYYYNMDISLLYKSGILVASGTILLFGYLYMKKRKLIK